MQQAVLHRLNAAVRFATRRSVSEASADNLLYRNRMLALIRPFIREAPDVQQIKHEVAPQRVSHEHRRILNGLADLGSFLAQFATRLLNVAQIATALKQICAVQERPLAAFEFGDLATHGADLTGILFALLGITAGRKARANEQAHDHAAELAAKVRTRLESLLGLLV
ncbi:hypothetical protein PQR46_18760 [Paraburkholderia sediminicola]|uniref:hypothetical protein n=1 Tax=Paraburkholderia sediminicola TaxID=458836 RepID=UPI0038B97959